MGYGNLQITGLVGFGALVAEAHHRGTSAPKSNGQPFEHLGDLGQIREQLARRLGA